MMMPMPTEMKKWKPKWSLPLGLQLHRLEISLDWTCCQKKSKGDLDVGVVVVLVDWQQP